MILKIKKDILLENLLIVSRAISSKNLIPVLSGIKLKLTKKELLLIATDNNIAIQITIPESKIEYIEEEGDIVLPGKYLVDIIRKTPTNIIQLKTISQNIVKIDYDKGEFNINSMKSSDFPTLDLNLNKEKVTLNSEDFKNIINETAFAISSSESRPILTGINLRSENKKLLFFATDSYRLAKKVLPLKKELNNLNIVIPGKSLIEFGNIIKENIDKIEIHVFDNKVLLVHDNIIFQSRLLAGNFPEVTKLIPTKFKIEKKINILDLYNAIDRASLLSNERDKVIVKLTLANNSIIINSNTPELGKVEEVINIENSQNFSISFVSKYMLEALKSFNKQDILICFNEEDKPFILKEAEDEKLIQLVLPIKTY